MMRGLGTRVMHDLLTILASNSKNSVKMNRGLNLLARYRAREIAATLYSHGDAEVRSGPFQGMTIHKKTSEGNVAPKLLGSDELSALAGRRVLVICDIEGGERQLLDPDSIPALTDFDILVELHRNLDMALPEEIIVRFGESHDIERVAHQGRDPNAFAVLEKSASSINGSPFGKAARDRRRGRSCAPKAT